MPSQDSAPKVSAASNTMDPARDDFEKREFELFEEELAPVLPGTETVNSALAELVQNTNDLIIIGSGPAGYTAATYAARAQLFPLVFEGSVEAGGALMTTTEVENFPGFPEGIQGPELMDKLREQAEKFGSVLVTDDVAAVELTDELKTVVQADGTVHKAKAVILAMGSGYRKLGLLREFELSGRGVSWCATCDGFFFRDQHVVVVGGGDSALEEALFLTKFASKVTLVHRRNELRASKIMQKRALENPKMEFLWDSEVSELHGEESLEKLTVRNRLTGLTRELDATGLFIAIGHDPRSEIVRGQVELDAEGYVLTHDNTTATNLPGVFAAGDLVDHRYRQAITAAGSGCQAALDAERWLSELAAL